MKFVFGGLVGLTASSTIPRPDMYVHLDLCGFRAEVLRCRFRV